MKHLYLRIYFAVLAALALLALAAGFTWSRWGDHEPHDALRNGIARLAANALPPADAPPVLQQAALEKLFAEVPAGVALYSAQRERMAAINSLPITLTLPADRTQSGLVVTLSGPPLWAIKLNDGRWLMVQPQMAMVRPRLSVLLMLALIALAVGVGAYPVVRRLTRRLERLQTGVEALGAGTLSARVQVEGKDEVARLAESFNRAATRIEELVNAHKSLLAHASHELRTPLTRLRLGLEFLTPGADPRRTQALARDIAELDELIEEILLASRLDTAAQAPMPEDVDLLALMAEVCAQYDTATFDGEPVTLRGDARLLKRMVRNLLENAQRHGAPPIAVTLHANTDKVEIKVCDQGPGVPEAERERVFEPFYRRAGATEGGVGLGLALVRQIARRHGGDALAQGNCFTVQLPL